MIPPPAPQFGDPCPIVPSAEVLDFLAGRRSASPFNLAAPAPDADQLDAILRLAARVPDHGKLAPWRFVVLEGPAKARFVEALHGMTGRQETPEKAAAVLGKIATPPMSVVVISSPKGDRIPLWEQQMSAGAACMTLCLAAQAMGFGANWITDWYAFDSEALALIGAEGGEQVAGYIHLGTVTEAPLERVRPDMAQVVSRWE